VFRLGHLLPPNPGAGNLQDVTGSAGGCEPYAFVATYGPDAGVVFSGRAGLAISAKHDSHRVTEAGRLNV
jgi:hypothetical protein